ncbi:MauE/DoxX family redox-associated membrane protein [Paramicrobacterium chengjingii]|uniref:Methylamine utilisation protein MauE domain-containing protein n=1 Tax=Paramicrobacterium chengjingii TaxID=2769067 RepID=A0ABX6YF99_9MICO|nr:MauE/DoxX family redox-associated membrane protein [Microbacterium chengjingii]QPZ37469.1 hypothetical protein HCR76_11555 [Microbacterium chengjingii]
MSEVLVLVPLALAVVLVASGVLKLRDSRATRASLDDLPIPRFLRTDIFATAFPVCEILLGAAVLVAPAPLFLPVIWVTALLFDVYLCIVIIAARRPEPVMCNCFGSLSRSPIGAATIVRNVALTLLALFASVGLTGTTGVLVRFPQLSASSQEWLVAALVLSALGIAVAILVSLSDPTTAQSPFGPATEHKLGSTWPIPDVEVVDWNGDVKRLASLAEESPVLLILVKSGCTACKLVTDKVPEWIEILGHRATVILATSTPRSQFLNDYPDFETRTVWGYRALVSTSGIRGVPSAILIADHVAGPAYGVHEIDLLARQAAPA